VGLQEIILKNGNGGSLDLAKYFQTFTAFAPTFTPFSGGVYDMEVTRAAIHAFAEACSKLKPEVTGKGGKQIARRLKSRPNPFMSTSQFLARVATILSVHNTAFIAPLSDENDKVTGFFPLLPAQCEIVEEEGTVYLRYTFFNGRRAAIEIERVGILTRHQFRDDFFGEDNRAFKPTLELINAQNQGIVSGIKNSANIRFLAQLMGMIESSDAQAAKEQFTKENLSKENENGVLMYDSRFSKVEQIKSTPTLINAEQIKQIHGNVHDYFGISENIIQNKFNEDEWNAFYEGKIEPFAIQLSQAMTNMTFSPEQIDKGSEIIFSAARLQYASNATKLSVSTQLFDRGLISYNDVADIWNMPRDPINGDKRYIRKEYAEIDKLGKDDGESGSGGGKRKPEAAAEDSED
jgi:HK97 family phage portal protein